MISEEDIGYKVGKWYMVEIDDEIYVPAKFLGLRKPCSQPKAIGHSFPHPGEAIFENVKLYFSCGFEGTEWEKGSGYWGGRYTSFRPVFRPVNESELWAVQAIERFRKVIAGRLKNFSITLPNGFRFEGKIKPPKKKDNLAGEYSAKVIDPKNGQEREGKFKYNGKSESVHAFILSKLPGQHIVSVKPLKVFHTPPLQRKED